MKKIGLAIIRMQPMHLGHHALITRMMTEMDTVIIGLGSIQENKTINNPFTPAQRRTMIEDVFGNTGKHSKIKLLELKDLGAVNKIAWAMHVFGKIEGMNLSKPTHYYAGSKHDASWFDSINTEFGQGTLDIIIHDRLKDCICMSGTEIRKSIIDDTNDWKEYVPPIIIPYIENNFPKELLLTENIDVHREKEVFEMSKPK